MITHRKRGCAGRNCSCGMWIQCRNYIDIRTKKWKDQYNHNMEDIHNYYRYIFRLDQKMPESNLNG